MADPAFYRQDGAAIAEAKATLEALEQELATAYKRGKRWRRWRAERLLSD